MQSGIPKYGILRVTLNGLTIKLVSNLNRTDKSSYYYCRSRIHLNKLRIYNKNNDDILIEYTISIIIRIGNLVYKHILFPLLNINLYIINTLFLKSLLVS